VILIATGMAAEARLMAGPGVVVVAGGGDHARLERELDAAAGKARLIVSSGLAGALSSALAVGDVVVDGVWNWPGAHYGPVIGSDHPIATVDDKARAGRDGTLAVDMESHVARRVAARHGVPFLAVRVISDSALHALPRAALAGMRPDGGIALGAVLASLARQPGQLPALIRTARDAGKAMRVLRRVGPALAAI